MSLLGLPTSAVDLAESILAIPKPEYPGAFELRDYRCQVSGSGDSFTVEWYAMYDAPVVGDTFEAMQRLSELFGTTKINLGRGRSEAGCESCNHGSEYGTELTILAPTKHLSELRALADTRDYFDSPQVEEAKKASRA